MSAPQELFDARLKRALESAPDAHLRPDAAVRQAVLKAAHKAVAAPAAAVPASGSAAPWWRRWRGEGDAGHRADQGRMPWNAAFATVLVAGFVALLWQGQEVPDARVDSAAPVAAKPAPSAAAPPVAAPPAAPPPDAARAGERDRLNERERERRDAPRDDRSSRKAAAPQQGSQELAKAVPQDQSAARVAPVAPAAPPAAAPAAPAAPMAPMADAPPPPAAAAPMPQAAPAPRPQAAAPAAGLTARREAVAPSPALPAWTALRVPEGARATPLARADAGNLPGLLQSLTAPGFASGNAADSTAGSSGAAAAAAPAAPLRLELMRGADLLGMLEISGGQWRFTPVGDAAAQSGRVDAQTVRALRAELQRLGLLP